MGNLCNFRSNDPNEASPQSRASLSANSSNPERILRGKNTFEDSHPVSDEAEEHSPHRQKLPQHYSPVASFSNPNHHVVPPPPPGSPPQSPPSQSASAQAARSNIMGTWSLHDRQSESLRNVHAVAHHKQRQLSRISNGTPNLEKRQSVTVDSHVRENSPSLVYWGSSNNPETLPKSWTGSNRRTSVSHERSSRRARCRSMTPSPGGSLNKSRVRSQSQWNVQRPVIFDSKLESAAQEVWASIHDDQRIHHETIAEEPISIPMPPWKKEQSKDAPETKEDYASLKRNNSFVERLEQFRSDIERFSEHKKKNGSVILRTTSVVTFDEFLSDENDERKYRSMRSVPLLPSLSLDMIYSSSGVSS